MQIISNHYNIEICAINIETLSPIIYGENNQYKKRIYLLYTGIHFDSIVNNNIYFLVKFI